LVKEPWAPDLDVKADHPRPDGFDVLKLNHVRDVPTGIYTYHCGQPLLPARRRLARKLAATSSEACGISTADMTGGMLRTRSYFDGQGDRAMRWPQGVVPEDGLPATLRELVEGDCPQTMTVFPSLLMGRFGSLAPAVFEVSKRDAGTIRVPAGEFSGVEIRLESESGFLSYVFDSSLRYRLLRFSARTEPNTGWRAARRSLLDDARSRGREWLPERVR
jgi:hypothetical protein